MAGKRISELDEALALEVGALLEVVQSGDNFRIDANLIANIVAGIGNEAALLEDPLPSYDSLADFGSITALSATNAQHIAANGADSGEASGANVRWVLFVLGNSANLAQFALSPSADQVQVRYRLDNTWGFWGSLGGNSSESTIKPNFIEGLDLSIGDNTGVTEFKDSVSLSGGNAFTVLELDFSPNNHYTFVTDMVTATPDLNSQVSIDIGGANSDSFSACQNRLNEVSVFSANVGLRAYEYDSLQNPSVIQLGNVYTGFSLNNTDLTSLAYLKSDRELAFFDNNTKNLRRLSFDGSDYSLIGNPLNFPSASGKTQIVALDNNSLALYSSAENKLYYVTYSASDWTVQSFLTVNTVLDFWVQSVNEFDVFMANQDDAKVKQYRLNDKTLSFEYIKDVRDFIGSGRPILSSFDGSRYIGETDNDNDINSLTTYLFSVGQQGSPYQVEGIYEYKFIPKGAFKTSGSSITPVSLGVPTKLNNVTVSSSEENSFMLMDQDNRLTSISNRDFYAKVSANLNYAIDLNTGFGRLYFGIYKNGILFGDTIDSTFDQDSGNVYNPDSFSRIIKFSKDDFVELWVENPNNSQGVICDRLDVNVEFIGWGE